MEKTTANVEDVLKNDTWSDEWLIDQYNRNRQSEDWVYSIEELNVTKDGKRN